MTDFQQLIISIQQAHQHLQAQTVRAVNQALTVRNWLIGYYIVEFEQSGKERARYGQQLIPEISKEIKINGLSITNLKIFRQFYLVYPQIGQTVSDQWNFFLSVDNQQITISRTASDQLLSQSHPAIRNDYTSDATQLAAPTEKLISRLSFSHLTELIKIEDSHKRCFYEIECMKGTWSVRELKRQINSLYFERSGLSEEPEKLGQLVQQKIKPQTPLDIIKNI